MNKVYDNAVFLLIVSYILSLKLFGFSVFGFTVFLDRIILLLIVIVYNKEILCKDNLKNPVTIAFCLSASFYLLSAFIEVIRYNQTFAIIANIKKSMYFLELCFWTLIVNSVYRKEQLSKKVILLMIILTIFGILEKNGIKLADFKFINLLPKTYEQQLKLIEKYYRGENVRISCFFTHALSYGVILSLYIPYVLYQFEKKIIKRLVFFVTIILAIVNIWLTYSRIPLLLTTLLLTILLFNGFKHNAKNYKILWAIRFTFIMLFIFIFSLSFYEKINEIIFKNLFGGSSITDDLSIRQRLQDVYTIFNETTFNIFLGNGTGTYKLLGLGAVDNYYLTVFYENGIIGLLVVIFLIYSIYIFIKNNFNDNFYLKFIYFQVIVFNFTLDFFGFLEIGKFLTIILFSNSTTQTIDE